MPNNMFGGEMNSGPEAEEPEIQIGGNLLEEGFEQIRETDKGFDVNYFKEITSDVFFQIQAGSKGGEGFISVLFKANLLDYTVDEKSGDLIDSSMTTPVKFEEEWTWVRPMGTQDWKLEGIKEV